MSADYTNDSQQTLMRTVEYLAQDILIPKPPKELAEALGLSRDQAFRALWNLTARGWAEEAGGCYRLAPRITAMADRLRIAVAETLARYLPETRLPEARYSATCGAEKEEKPEESGT